MTDFIKIVKFSDWCYVDKLNGKDVASGQYEVQWPDGEITTEKLVVDEHYENSIFTICPILK